MAGWLLIIIGLLVFPIKAFADEELVPRILIAVYDKELEDEGGSLMHRMIELPLNYLGLELEYYDVNEKLPDLSHRKDVRGIISVLGEGKGCDDPVALLKWANRAIDLGLKYVVIGSTGFLYNDAKKVIPTEEINTFWQRLGLTDAYHWTGMTYDVSLIIKEPNLFNFEKKLSVFKLPFEKMIIIKPELIRPIVIGRQSYDWTTDSVLVALGKKGGFIAWGYAFFWDNAIALKRWIINPFEYFGEAYDVGEMPKPDIATIAGRRIYYSHIDGDGWNNESKLEQYVGSNVISAQAVMDNAIVPYPDLPVTVAVIAGDLDRKWFGNSESQKVARELFRLPQVEIGTHTYSHPFDWDFFEDGNFEKERKYLPLYEGKHWGKKLVNELNPFDNPAKTGEISETKMAGRYDIPRAYAVTPFNIDLEITGSAKKIEEFTPKGKKVKILMWSGSIHPFEQALRLTRLAGLKNINGGDSRFDSDYPSYAWVAPNGRRVGAEIQVYSSNSNENTYTDLWTGNFQGFQFLRKTLHNTESPIRLKAFNVYYHMYSGEQFAALNALTNNLDYARTQKLAPITASHFAGIGEGFFTTKIFKLPNNAWLVKNRKELATIRFDKATLKAVDFSRSTGVIGQNHYQGSLYVYLDDAVREATIALRDNPDFDTHPSSEVPYLIDSRWLISGMKYAQGITSFIAQGFGEGELNFYMPQNGIYRILFMRGNDSIWSDVLSVTNQQELKIHTSFDAIEPVHCYMELIR